MASVFSPLNILINNLAGCLSLQIVVKRSRGVASGPQTAP